MQIFVFHVDAQQAASISQVLAAAGHHCNTFANSDDMVRQLQRESCDALVIDWSAADSTAANILGWVRENLPSKPSILLLVNNRNLDHVAAGLEAGADDYLIKPIRKGELSARVQVLLRRAYPDRAEAEQVRFGPYTFETDNARLTVDGIPIALTQKEFELALLLFRNLGRPLSRAYILETIWTRDFEGSSRTMDTHVSRIRSKLHLHPEHGFRLAPVYSYGYRLEQVAA